MNGRALEAEFLGTAFLLVTIVGSGISAAVDGAFGGLGVRDAVGYVVTHTADFTSSASFANPAVTVARSLSDTYTGTAPGAIPGFLVAPAFGAPLPTSANGG